MNTILESGAKKFTENIADKAIDAIVDYAKDKYGKKQVELGNDFKRYLENAINRYNKVRTLATGPNPRTIIGDDNIYVDIGIKHKEKIVSTENVESLLDISNNLIIQGTGGIGKSMLMRYLFISTAKRGNYVPVLLELRRISNQQQGNISILELIYSSMTDFDVQLPREQFEYSLRLGKYLFLFDGFDEVKESFSEETAETIQNFSAKFPNNPCIITSRPKSHSTPLETFTTVESMTLDKDQAVLLASKIWPNDEKAAEFCKQLDSELYDKHEDFAENPLLLSMMFLTFMRNNSIPDNLSDFYQKAYEALYSAHDNNDKGVYKRDFACDSLDEGQFKLIFSRFCFITYFKEIYEFSKDDIIDFLDDCVLKLNIDGVNTNDYLKDLRNAVCLIIQDGDIFRFSHRSFQAYFAAVYTSTLGDETQKKLFSNYLSKEFYWNKADYYKLLHQIEREKFIINALEEKLREIQLETAKSNEPNIDFLKIHTNGVDFHKEKDEKNMRLVFYVNSNTNYHKTNAIYLFSDFIIKKTAGPIDNDVYNSYIKLLKTYSDKILKETKKNKKNELFNHAISYTDIEKYLHNEREAIYDAINYIHRTETMRQEISIWLHEVDEKRKLLNTDNFIDEL